jgi:4-oxalocrotonate tautomerase
MRTLPSQADRFSHEQLARTPGTVDHPAAEEHAMPLVNVKLVEGVFTEKQKHEMAAKLTDVMVAFEGSEAFREVVWVLIEELHRDGWHIGGQPFFGPPTLMGTLGRAKAAYDAIDGTPTTREDLATQAPVRHG